LIKCTVSHIHETVKLGRNVTIVSDDISIGEGTEIGDNATIIAYEKLVIGKFCKIRSNARFKARSIEIGDFFYSNDNPRPLIIGGGGSDRPTARIKIGNRCVMHDSFINVFMPVTIGDDVGLSPSSDILTHGFWGSVLDGYSGKFGPVTIKSGTIIGYRAIIMPNVIIGEHANIGAGAIVTKDVPDFSVVAGVPAKVIAGPPDYPKKLSAKERKSMCWQLTMQYAGLLKDKIDRVKVESTSKIITITGQYENEDFSIEYTDGFFLVKQGWRVFAINVISKINWFGNDSAISDDLRDFLRHFGIRIFSRWFKSIPPKIKVRLEGDTE